MSYHPPNHNDQNKKTLTTEQETSKNLDRYNPLKYSEQNINIDKETLNLFKGIVKITLVSNKKVNKASIIKFNSVNNKNISDLTNASHNNEEHLNKNIINTSKYSAKNKPHDNILTPKRPFRHSFSIKEKREKFLSSKMINIFSKERDIIQKEFSKKNSSNNFSIFSPKGESKKNSKFGDSGKNHKLTQKYSFFYKLKEKNKIPSKTPYLDKKLWKNSYNLDKYDYNKDDDNNSPNKKKIANKSLFAPNQSSTYNKNDIKNDLDKKLIPDKNKDDNNNAQNIKKEIKPVENNNDNEPKNYLLNKKHRKNICNIIVNILNKPFLCCLKS